MNLEEIKLAVDQGRMVHWRNSRYIVIKGKYEYMIACDEGSRNANYIGLTHKDGITMNGEEQDFYIGEEE